MMALARQWLLGLTCAAMVLAVAQALAPEGAVKKVVKLAGGLLLLLAAVSPLLRLEEGAASRALEEYRGAAQRRQEELTEQNRALYQAVIEERAAAYIVDKAGELGISCRAEVTFAYDEDGRPYPWQTAAWGAWTQEGRQALEALLERELGVPPERQHYYEENTP